MEERAITVNIVPVMLTPMEVAGGVAERVRTRRLDRGWSRAELAGRAGVSEETIKSFERRGQITLSRLLLIARSLDALGEFEALFSPLPPQSLEEIEARQHRRQRGRRRA